MTAPDHATTLTHRQDPRRWFAAAVVIASVALPVLHNTVLYLVLETIAREFASDLSALQWIITGYSLTFATLLIIGGRLGDLYGHRRTFVVGAAIFGAGSLVASTSQSVAQLFIGEAVLSGIGAALIMPATLSILSTTFEGRERATAFAAWGAVAGVAVIVGPLVGGFLTTYHSWRWAFRMNVIVAPIIVAGALLFMRRDARATHRPRIDIPGALMLATGSFSLIFALSESTAYGWWTPLDDLVVGDTTLWAATRPVSIVSLAIVVSAVAFGAFVSYELAKERRHADPLFEFGQLRHLRFRYGLITTTVLAMGQFGLLFVLPVLLQRSAGFSPLRAGAWLVPMGIAIALGAPIGGWLTRMIDTTAVVRIGLGLEALGLAMVAIAVDPNPSFVAIVPGTVLFGTGIGFAGSQLTNVTLADVDPERAGVAGGTNATVRQVGVALGVATFAAIVESYAAGHPGDVGAIADGSRAALVFATCVVSIGTLLSLLIPRVGPTEPSPGALAVEIVDAYENLDIDPRSAR
jgi:EmrB/QacA subfamily drug resistance transporter